MSFLLNEEGAMERLVEALLFASDEPLTKEKIRKILMSVPESGFGQSTEPVAVEGENADSSLETQKEDSSGEENAVSEAPVSTEVLSQEPEETALTEENSSDALTEEASPAQSVLPGSPKPLSRYALRSLLEKKIEAALNAVREKYSTGGSPVVVLEMAGGWQLATNAQYSPWVKRLYKDRTTFRLSNPALETLAIIAYKQPITRAEVEDIRGVESISAFETLLERNLIKTSGRKETVGRPILYATTSEFLRQFGLRSLDDMPIPEVPQEELEKTQENSAVAVSASTDDSAPVAESSQDPSAA